VDVKIMGGKLRFVEGDRLLQVWNGGKLKSNVRTKYES